MLYVTTSWDDGDVLDERVARLLEKYNLTGTFYVSKEYRSARLSDEQIKRLSLRHEIGAHTLTHPDLRDLSYEQQKQEIESSKKWLEELLGHAVSMFCYPSGHFGIDTENIVREIGFKGARTIAFGEITSPKNPFQMATTLSVYPIPFRKTGPNTYYWSKLLEPLKERGSTLRALGVPLLAFRSWEALACAAFDIAVRRGEVFHLWGHSWEIDRYGMWEELERVLYYISNRQNCRYVTNGALIPSNPVSDV